MCKRTIVVLFFVLCLFIVSSCGEKTFKYDNAISWNSSLDDIVKKYGNSYDEQAGTTIGDKDDYGRYIYFYDVIKYGYGDFHLDFLVVDSGDKGIAKIVLGNRQANDSLYERIVKDLTAQFGEPKEKTDNFFGTEGSYAMKWEKPVKDTFILLRYYNSIIEINYYNSKYYSSIRSIAN